MVRSSYSVVAININSFYHNWVPYHGSLNMHELSLATHIQGKIFQWSHVSTKIFYLELYYHWNIFYQINSEIWRVMVSIAVILPIALQVNISYFTNSMIPPLNNKRSSTSRKHPQPSWSKQLSLRQLIVILWKLHQNITAVANENYLLYSQNISLAVIFKD